MLDNAEQKKVAEFSFFLNFYGEEKGYIRFANDILNIF